MYKIEIIGRLLIQHNLSEHEAILLLSEEFAEKQKELDRLQLINDLRDGFFITDEEALVFFDEHEGDSFFHEGNEYKFKIPFKPINFSAS